MDIVVYMEKDTFILLNQQGTPLEKILGTEVCALQGFIYFFFTREMMNNCRIFHHSCNMDYIWNQLSGKNVCKLSINTANIPSSHKGILLALSGKKTHVQTYGDLILNTISKTGITLKMNLFINTVVYLEMCRKGNKNNKKKQKNLNEIKSLNK